MDDFRRRPVNRVQPSQGSTRPSEPINLPAQQTPLSVENSTSRQQVRPVAPSTIAPQPLVEPPVLPPLQKKRSRKKRVIGWVLGIIFVVLLIVGAAISWYFTQLLPVDAKNINIKVVTIASGSTPSDIADLLKKEGIIKNPGIFLMYARLEGVQNKLQAGAYRLTPSESTQQIVEHLVNGRVDTFNVMLYPGATLIDTTNTPESKKYDVTTALKRAGFTDEQITQGLSAQYPEFTTTLFQGRPASAGLEGYVYGDTYTVSADSTVEDVLRTSFSHFWAFIEKNNLVEKYKQQNLSLYQGITLASIVQRESGADNKDKDKIAQVFYTRYRSGDKLGSDVTYQYITDKLGVARDINFDSPYNTRRYSGLPPGPIAVPGRDALIAVGNPSQTDYVYFLSGDDDVTYFARTYAEHEANIRNHCQTKCQIL